MAGGGGWKFCLVAGPGPGGGEARRLVCDRSSPERGVTISCEIAGTAAGALRAACGLDRLPGHAFVSPPTGGGIDCGGCGALGARIGTLPGVWSGCGCTS